MRSILGAASFLLVGALAACGGADGGDAAEPQVSVTTSASPTPPPPAACDLLTRAQRQRAVGARVDFRGRADKDFPDSTCTFGNVAGGKVTYRVMSAPTWAQEVPNLAASELNASMRIDDALTSLGKTKGDLASMDGAAACEFWAALNKVQGHPVSDGMTSHSLTGHRVKMQAARAARCSEGVYVDILIVAPDADSRAGRKRAEKALATAHANAVKDQTR